MTIPTDINELLVTVAELDRPELVELLREVPCRFPVDFTDEYLNTLSLDRLRHVVVAVCLQARKNARLRTEQAA